MKKIIYIVNARIPTGKAHGIQIMKMCEAFSDEGNDVELILPRRLNKNKQNPFGYYGVKENFKIKKLPVLDLVFTGLNKSFLIEVLTYFISLFFYLLFVGGDRVIYVRGEPIFVPLFLKKKNVFWETHIKPEKTKRYKKVFEKVDGLITVTKFYKKELTEKFNIPENKVFYFPDGVDLKKFDISLTKEEARSKTGLALDKKIVLYVGHLYDWKGTQVLADASKYLNKETLVVFVGGTVKDIENFKQKNKEFENVIIVGHKSHSEVVYWQKSADVLVLPNSAKSNISMYYTSPMKLFEYMAVKRPIVASDLPSFRDVLNENNSVLVEPDNPQKLAEGINSVLRDKLLSEQIANQSFGDVQEYTWKNRAEKIISFIKSEL